MADEIKQDVKDTITQKVAEVALDPTNTLQRQDVPQVSQALNTTLGPWILSMTNNEPWYQSKIIWGLIIAGVGTIAKPFVGDLVPAEKAAQIVDALATAGQFAGIALAGWARLRASRSITK